MIEQVMELLKRQFAIIMQNDEDYYGNYKVYLSNEQQYVREKSREKDAIYIVVKFMQASLNFGQTILPVTINAIAERNKIEVCQKLLLEFAQEYNLTTDASGTIKQTFTSPANMSSFNEMFDGFRSLFYMSGTFLISSNSNTCTLLHEGAEVPCITFNQSFDVNLDSQAFYSTKNMTSSVAMTGTHTISISTYLIMNDFCNKVIKVMTNADGFPIGTGFMFTIQYKNGFKIENKVYRLVNCSVQQNAGELPMATMTFTN